MYIYQDRLVNSGCLYETTQKKLSRSTVYTYPIRLINSRCLHEAAFEIEAIVRVYLTNSPSELALFARYNS